MEHRHMCTQNKEFYQKILKEKNGEKILLCLLSRDLSQALSWRRRTISQGASGTAGNWLFSRASQKGCTTFHLCLHYVCSFMQMKQSLITSPCAATKMFTVYLPVGYNALQFPPRNSFLWDPFSNRKPESSQTITRSSSNSFFEKMQIITL